MTAHLRMDAPDERNRLDDMVQGVLGQPLDRPEGRLKVTGRAPYAAEVLPEGLAYGVLVRATVTHGRLRDLASEDVQAMPGVLAVLSDPRMLRNPAQGTAGKAPVQGPDEIFYFGQPIALVVAESFEQARHAAQSLHPTFDILDGPTEPEGPDVETERPKAKQSDQGDIDEAMAKAAFTVDQTLAHPRPRQRRDGAARRHRRLGRRHADAARQLPDAQVQSQRARRRPRHQAEAHPPALALRRRWLRVQARHLA